MELSEKDLDNVMGGNQNVDILIRKQIDMLTGKLINSKDPNEKQMIRERIKVLEESLNNTEVIKNERNR